LSHKNKIEENVRNLGGMISTGPPPIIKVQQGAKKKDRRESLNPRTEAQVKTNKGKGKGPTYPQSKHC